MMMTWIGGIAYRGAFAMRVRPSLALSQMGTVAACIVTEKSIPAAARDSVLFAGTMPLSAIRLDDLPHFTGENRLPSAKQGTANGRDGCWSGYGGEAH